LIRSGGCCTVEHDQQFIEGFETNKLVFGDSDEKKKKWQALLEEEQEWIMLNNRVDKC
jgi:hypothetical protein